MSDVLSADEVDALLEGVSSGAIKSNSAANLEFTPYDLTATEHIARSDIPSMDLVNLGFARALKKSFRSALGDGIEIEVGDVTEEKFADQIATLPEPTMLYQLKIPELRSEAVFVLSAELIRNYVDLYFGGGAKALEPTPREGFTRAEGRVAQQILEFSLRDLMVAWAPVESISIDVKKNESSPQFCKFMEAAEPIVVSKFSVAFDEETSASLSCILSASMLSPLYEKMDASSRGSQSEHRSTWTRELKRCLTDVELPLSTPIASKTLSLGKLVRLRAGDIIPIELNETVTLQAGSVALFSGKFGVSKNRNSIQIEQSLK